MARRSQFKACKECDALVDKEAKVCPLCGSTQFTDTWSGILIVIDPQGSFAARVAGRAKPALYAIKKPRRRTA